MNDWLPNLPPSPTSSTYSVDLLSPRSNTPPPSIERFPTSLLLLLQRVGRGLASRRWVPHLTRWSAQLRHVVAATTIQSAFRGHHDRRLATHRRTVTERIHIPNIYDVCVRFNNNDSWTRRYVRFVLMVRRICVCRDSDGLDVEHDIICAGLNVFIAQPVASDALPCFVVAVVVDSQRLELRPSPTTPIDGPGSFECCVTALVRTVYGGDCSGMFLAGSHLGSRMMPPLVAYMLWEPSVRSLDLAGNRIGDAGAKAICTLLLHNRLTSLNLDRNGLTECGVESLARCLQDAHDLEFLSLCSNSFTTRAMACLARAVAPHPTLGSLLLEDNVGITDAGLRSLSAALMVNRSIHTLSLRKTCVSDPAVVQLASCLRSCAPPSPLRHLNISGTLLTDRAVEKLCAAIPYTKLSHLDISAVAITERVAVMLCEVSSEYLRAVYISAPATGLTPRLQKAIYGAGRGAVLIV